MNRSDRREGRLDALVIAALIAGAAQVLVTAMPYVKEWCIGDSPSDIAGNLPVEVEHPQPSTNGSGEPQPSTNGFGEPQPSTNRFGEWAVGTSGTTRYEAGKTYEAKSDGFITAYTGGNNPADGILIYVGNQSHKLTIRTRAGRYDGTVCPVTEGHYWMVKADNGGRVIIHWLPVMAGEGG